MTANQKVASALITLVRAHLLKQESSGALLFQVEEFCEDYETIRNIKSGDNIQSKEEQQQILLEYARMYNIDRTTILQEVSLL